MMPKIKIMVIFLVVLALSSILPGETSSSSELSSGPEARTLYEIARGLYGESAFGPAEAEQAMVLLNAALSLDDRANYILTEVINIGWLYPEQNYTDAVYLALDRYVNATSDLEVSGKAVEYLLERLNSREEREELLTMLLRKFGSRNKYFASDLVTQLGLLTAEKPDIDAANFYLMQGYRANQFNNLAFAKLLELTTEPVDNTIILFHLRNMMTVNPLDFETVFGFAQMAESLMLHSIAEAGYQYCADLFIYLNLGQPLPRSLYLPWLQSCYNMEGNQSHFQQVIEQVRRQTDFDILAEAIAAKSAVKISDTRQADNIFRRIDAEAHVISIADNAVARVETFVELAWYYSFIKPDEQKALIWATKAYDIDSNSPGSASIFAYALKINGQDSLAKPIVEPLQGENQIAAITMALIVGTENAESAVEILNSAIAANPASLEASYAKTLLAKYDSEYVPSIDTAELIIALEDKFGSPVITEFVGVEKILSTRLNIRGAEFSYGKKIDVDLIITNTSSQPLFISDEGLFRGNIRIDGRITGGMEIDMPNLIFKKIRPSSIIKSGNAISVPLQIMASRLGKLLNNHPQADLQVELTAYLDPIVEANGKVFNSIDVAPAKLSFKRKKIPLDSRYLRQRLDAIASGQYGQKVRSAKLFAGLLAEQQSMTETGPLYRLMYMEPARLKSALIRIMDENDWDIRLQTMAAMLPLKLDYELIEAVAERLTDEKWPIRMMSVFMLAKSQQQFQSVVDWTAEHDENQLVRDMALALGAVAKPEKIDLPTAEDPNSD